MSRTELNPLAAADLILPEHARNGGAAAVEDARNVLLANGALNSGAGANLEKDRRGPHAEHVPVLVAD
jgi:hypothetical protein